LRAGEKKTRKSQFGHGHIFEGGWSQGDTGKRGGFFFEGERTAKRGLRQQIFTVMSMKRKGKFEGKKPKWRHSKGTRKKWLASLQREGFTLYGGEDKNSEKCPYALRTDVLGAIQ